MRNVSDKSSRQNRNTHFIFGKFSENLALYELMWKNMVQSDNPWITIQRGAEKMRCAYRITKTRKQTLLILNTYCFIID
jgi:hypothetical protein